MKTNPLGLSTSAVIEQERVGFKREKGGQGVTKTNKEAVDTREADRITREETTSQDVVNTNKEVRTYYATSMGENLGQTT